MAFQRQLLSRHTNIPSFTRTTHLSSSVKAASIDNFASPWSQTHTVYRVGIRHHSHLPHLQNSPRLASALKEFRKDKDFSTSSERSAAKDPLLNFKSKAEEMGKSWISIRCLASIIDCSSLQHTLDYVKLGYYKQ